MFKFIRTIKRKENSGLFLSWSIIIFSIKNPSWETHFANLSIFLLLRKECGNFTNTFLLSLKLNKKNLLKIYIGKDLLRIQGGKLPYLLVYISIKINKLNDDFLILEIDFFFNNFFCSFSILEFYVSINFRYLWKLWKLIFYFRNFCV